MKKRPLMLVLSLCLLAVAALALAEALPAKDWADKFPDQYATFLKNAENDQVHDYVAAHPQIAVLYEGSGFGYSYFSPRGHEYTLEDVQNIGRPHPLANCLTCKSGDYTALVNRTGFTAYSMPFDEAMQQLAGGISCYNCHGNEVPQLQVTHAYLLNAVGTDDIDPRTLSCGQCHVEYYFPQDTNVTKLPYAGHENASPEAIYAYYQALGFTDYVNPRTGTNMVKVQHPEFETYTGEGSVHKGMFSCSDCHMEPMKNDAGTSFRSHQLVSPLQSPVLLESCNACHNDLTAFVKDIQDRTETRTFQVADKLVELTNLLADKVSAGADDAVLEPIRALNREAQFYWDFVFVENSEGVHNSKLAAQCLDKAEALCDEALVLVKQ